MIRWLFIRFVYLIHTLLKQKLTIYRSLDNIYFEFWIYPFFWEGGLWNRMNG